MSHPGVVVALNGITITPDTLDGVTISYGRQRVTEQPAPSTCQLRVFTDMGDWEQVRLGDELHVSSETWALSRFVGRVVSVSIGRYVTTVTATSSALGALALQRVRNFTANPGGNTYTVGGVLLDILNTLYSPPDYGTIDLGWVTLLPDIDLGTTSALSAMHTVVASDMNGVLSETPAGLLEYVAGRTDPGAISMVLPAAAVSDSWQAVTSLSTLMNACAVTYGEAGSTITVRDYDSIATYGVFMGQRSMQVTGVDDALAGGMAWVNALSTAHWSAQPLTFELTLLSDGQQGLWLEDVACGSPVDTSSIAAQLPGIPAACWVEGWVETISRSRWTVNAYLSDLQASIRPQLWNEVTPTLTWDAVTPTLTWLQASSTTL